MIAYRITRAELERLIEAHAPGWLKRAAERTRAFRKTKKYNEKSSIWSEIKPVYMELQGQSKCVYCERKLESVTYGKGEQDVEHFRPKKCVREWKLPPGLESAGIVVTRPRESAKGYYLLPYDIFNYAASCGPCNSVLKRNYFPIAGKYRATGSRSEVLLSEGPLLIYPLGDFDDKPEDLIRFYGLFPRPVVKTAAHKRSRALVTIEFFRLDDAIGRKNLMRERAAVIVALYPQLEASQGETQRADRARRLIAAFTSSRAPHANCARSFVTLFEKAPNIATQIHNQAVAFVESAS